MQFFITATGTDIGKTFVLENICRQLLKSGKKVLAIKPIISGFKDNDLSNDSSKILATLELDINQKNLDSISPYRFKAPLSPNIAANLENTNINFEELVKFCQNKINQAIQSNSYLFIEGAGGVMTPINNDKTFADLISELKIPAILITGNYLGTISHTLTSVKAMQAHNIKIFQIVLNCRDNQVSADEHLKTLRQFTKTNISNQIEL